MVPRPEWRWKPTESQRVVFNEWKDFVVGYLVSCREGTNIGAIPGILEEQTGEVLPLAKMGFRTINQFLYEMSDSIEVRSLYGKYFVFIREGGVPSHMMNIRQMVLGQAKDKACKSKSGVIRRPTKNQSSYCRPEELLDAVQHIINRPAYNNAHRPVVVPVSLPGAKRPYMSSNVSRTSGQAGSFQPRSNSIQSRSSNSISSSTQRFSRPTPMSSQNSRMGYATNATQRPVEKILRDPRGAGSGSNNSISGSSSQVGSAYQSAGRASAYSSNKSSMTSGYSNGKENLPSSSMKSSASLSQNGWDDWTGSTNKPRSTLSTVPSMSSSHRPIRIPQGLILSDGSDSDSGDFDYYCSASSSKTPTTGKESSSNIKVTIPNPPTRTTLAASDTSSSTSSTVTLQPRSVISKPQSVANQSMTTTTVTKPALPPVPSFGVANSVGASASNLAPTTFSSLPKPTASETKPSPAAGMSTKSEESKLLQKPLTLTDLNYTRPTSSSCASSLKPTTSTVTVPVSHNLMKKTQPSEVNAPPQPTQLPAQNSATLNKNSDIPKTRPVRGLGTDGPLTHSLEKNPCVRMAFNLPTIRFPPFFRGGSLQANLSLKAYLSGF